MIEEIQLDFVLPENGVRMVFMQPCVELTQNEPFRWQNSKRSGQISRIIRTLEIAKQPAYNCAKTHFTIFPEYSIPGLDGIREIEAIVRDDSWQKGTILIGGVDGLRKDEYSILCSESISQVHDKNRAEVVSDGKWINCCVTWTKEDDDSLRRWIQPKLSPSWVEKKITHSEMFCGRSAYLFSAKFENQTECRFLSLLCFDWIGPIASSSRSGIWAVLNEVNNLWRSTNARREMNLVFILQCNEEPNHRNFLENARNYFENRREYPFIIRDPSIVVFANTAGIDRPGKSYTYGYSSLISSPSAPYDNRNCCPLSYASITTKLRNTDSLGRCKEALFREGGACNHSFKFRFPSFIPSDPANRCLVLDEAGVYAIDDGMHDPRTPGGSVPASVKWINDELEEIESILHHQNRNPIRNQIGQSHEEISLEFKGCSGAFLCKIIECAVYKYDKLISTAIHNVDDWDDREQHSLVTVIYSLSILKSCKSMEVTGSTAHATMKVGTNVIDVIVVVGGNTSEECFEYGKQFLNNESRFGVIITRDIHDQAVNKGIHKSILETEGEITGKGPNIANPDERFIHCGYQNLRNSCFDSRDMTELNNKITELIGI